MQGKISVIKKTFPNLQILQNYLKDFRIQNGKEPVSYEVTFIYDKAFLEKEQSDNILISENAPPMSFEMKGIGENQDKPVTSTKAKETLALSNKIEEIRTKETFRNEHFHGDNILKFPKVKDYLKARKLFLKIEDQNSKTFSLNEGSDLYRKEACDFFKSMRISKYYYKREKKGQKPKGGKKNSEHVSSTLRSMYFEKILSKEFDKYVGKNKETIFDVIEDTEARVLFKKGLFILVNINYDYNWFCKKVDKYFKRMIYFSFEFNSSEEHILLSAQKFLSSVLSCCSGELVCLKEDCKESIRVHILGKPQAWQNLIDDEIKHFRLMRGSPDIVFHNRFPNFEDLASEIEAKIQELESDNMILETYRVNSKKIFKFKTCPSSIPNIISDLIELVEKEFDNDWKFFHKIFEKGKKFSSGPNPNPCLPDLNPPANLNPNSRANSNTSASHNSRANSFENSYSKPNRNFNSTIRFSMIFYKEKIIQAMNRNPKAFIFENQFFISDKCDDYFSQFFNEKIRVAVKPFSVNKIWTKFCRVYHDVGGDIEFRISYNKTTNNIKLAESLDRLGETINLPNMIRWFGDLWEDIPKTLKFTGGPFEFVVFICLENIYGIMDDTILPLCCLVV